MAALTGVDEQIKNGVFARESTVCRMVDTDEIGYASSAQLSDKIRKWPPSRTSIRAWYNKFMETGSVSDRKKQEDQAQARMTLNVFGMHLVGVLASRFVLLLENWKCQNLPFTRCYTNDWGCMRTRFNLFRHLILMIYRNTKHLQRTFWTE